VSEPQAPPARPPEIADRPTRRAWWIFAVSFFILGLIAVLRLGTGRARPIDLAVVGLVVVVGFAAIRHRQAVAALEVGRREEAESFARILSGLSRSVSPDAILGAIVTELASATAADHIVIVRRRPNARVLEATLVSARPGVPDSATVLPIGDLEDAVETRTGSAGRERVAFPLATGQVPGEPQLVADRIAARAGRVYGLVNTLAAPLISEHAVIGAIVLSRRTAGPWSETTRRILSGAALEASAALARAYSHRAAEEQAATDALTGLPNRRYFDEFCGLLARRRRSRDAVGVLMIDIDRFKDINDAHGHASGDEVLRAVGGAIVSAVREDDVPARYGGEEFVVLLRNPTPEVALGVGERVRASVAALDLGRLGVSGVSVSVGVAVATEADQAIDDLVVLADRALYRAKRAGRDRVVAA
jgi:diguanylate cyclase (GGDEF)-like protein